MHFNSQHRRGFTLVELLMVMLIIGIVVTLSAMVFSSAVESAKAAKTQALITKLSALVLQRYETYRYRRLPLVMPPFVKRPSDHQLIPTPPAVAAQARCDAIRQLMRMEMPERWTDITDGASLIELWQDPIKKIPYLDPDRPGIPAYVSMPASAVAQSYQASYGAAYNSQFKYHKYDSAKCLYLLVTMGLEEPDVMENFSPDEIADPDGAGCKCFIDGWGNPIAFLRWAPGYVSPLQTSPPTAADLTDPTQVYGSPNPHSAGEPQTFALYPLIYSAGPDGYYDLVDEADPNTTTLHYGNQTGQGNPFYSTGGASVHFSHGPIGTPAVWPVSDQASGRTIGNSDNIDNHHLGNR